MKPLSGLDGAFLHLETPETPMHVASLHLFDAPPGYRGGFHDQLKVLMRERLHLAPVFTRKLAPMPLQFANPVWIEDDAVDLDYHVRRVTLPAPGTLEQFEDCAAQLHAELLDRHRPLWQLVVIDGLANGQLGYYFKVHHAVVDGQSGVMLAKVLFDLEPAPRRIDDDTVPAGEHPGLAQLAAAALRHDVGQYVKLVRQLPLLVKTLGETFGRPSGSALAGLRSSVALGPRTPLNAPITGARGFAGASVPLATLKALADAHDAKLNDVVMALCAGALRRWLAVHGGIPKKPLIAAMPISVRAPGNTEYTTQATMALVNLSTHLSDPVKRLLAIRDAAGAVKATAKRTKDFVPTDFPSIGVPWLLSGLATLYGRSGLAKALPPVANLTISNVPGPQVPLYAAGARMRHYWPVSIVEHGLGLNVTVLSYDGTMDFGFVTARNLVDDARELTRALRESVDELVAASHLRAARKPAAPRKRAAAKKAPAAKAPAARPAARKAVAGKARPAARKSVPRSAPKSAAKKAVKKAAPAAAKRAPRRASA
jgi:WS/DGAT/MGAT family acyltransferase